MIMQQKKSIVLHFSVFLVGFTLFMFEITLTRLFSALMWYHFVFFAISLAMLGWAVGGVYAHRWLKSLEESPFNEDALPIKKQRLLAALAASILLAILFMYKVPFNFSLVFLYTLTSALPFILGGYYLSLVFKENAQNSNTIYFADLLGSACGSFLIILFLNNFSLIRISIILSLVVLLVFSFNLTTRKKKILASSLTAVMLILTVAGGAFLDSFAKDFTAYKGNPKTLGALSEKNPRIVFTTWNSLARTDVVETDDIKYKTVLVDGGATSRMIAFNGDPWEVAYLTQEVGYFPFALGAKNSALLIGPGGGKDILLAHLGGIHDITAVEINPGTVKAAEYFKGYNGNIYGFAGTKVFVEDGRSFITRDNNKYDVIFLSLVMTQASETLGYALSENYIYTKEAFNAYLNHLTPDGTLAFVLHGKEDLQKALATVLKVLEERGVPQEKASQYLAVINSSYRDGKTHAHDNSIMYPLLMVKNSPFAKEESQQLQAMATLSNQPIIHLPLVMDNSEAIIPPAKDLPSYIVTDNNPFFYNPGKGVPLPILLILVAVYLVGARFFKPWLEIKESPVRYVRNYFSLIGVAFMLIEIPLLQKLILLFGHPTLTFSTVIAILLFATGLGSLFSKTLTRKIPLPVIGLMIFLYTGVLYLALPGFIAYFQGATLGLKVISTSALLLPLGILMGIPFPTGIRWAEEQDMSEMIPIIWGINGWMSVVGSVLSLVLAMSLGYNFTLLAGAGLYLAFTFHTRKGSFRE